MSRIRVPLVLTALLTLFPTDARASVCDSPAPEWLMCEDFEQGALGWESWFSASPFVECLGCSGGVNDPARIRLSNDPAHVFDGDWAVFLPAEASASYQGAELKFRTCAGDPRPGCTLTNHDTMYLRVMTRLAPDHQYVHHFLSIGGTRPDAYWEGDGNAGCRPNGVRHAGTTLDFNRSHELLFYTYYPEMGCDSGGYCSGSYATDICAGCAMRDLPCASGPECCWGNLFSSDPRPILPRDEWVCLEMMMRINTPGASDGEMAFWMNDELMHRQTGMHWRDVAELGLNRANLSHYIATGDADQSNRISFDDMIVSTNRIGCSGTSPPPPLPDGGTPPPTRDAGGAPGMDAGAPGDGGPPPGRDAASGSPEDPSVTGSCGACAVGATDEGQPTPFVLAVLLLVALRRRG